MRARKHRSSQKEKVLAAKLYAERNSARGWDEIPVEVQIQPNRAVVTSLRLPVGEFAAMQSAAKTAGLTVSEFIRSAIATRLHGGIRVAAIQIAAGSSEGRSQATVLAPTLESGQTRNPGPDMTAVPLYANLG